ncbi:MULTISPECIES: glucose 1-dehydrogenase [unclassified Frondihabitans]|uniref:glucose 1-dehydrogenase n=1 Tax=unclassified Frondihabitans TaxID=2626248 RepID=UPI000F4D6AB2|nr:MULTISPECIES: glucose 1-dehydrogenase [unclassified Frondihabitans]RPE74214.1 NAD(P)-dependent dehydrogenase (short-subunit alcohol dehydrogenase family) [Frondihabitans sp. PhB153]RPF02644.1 NAD(P)-dependent dehydrogenase (short-subunit alcohol dehydrogenase family) [Frondihabitans sp. PhB161]
MPSSTRFTDRVVLITGGGSGLGRATALRLAAEGAKLALVDISQKGLDESKAAVLEATPEAEILTTLADVSEEADVDAYVEATLERFGRIDGFFNNAGIEGRQNLTENFSADEFDKVVAINLRGVFLGLEKVLKIMREQGSGMVVNTASVGGITGIGNQSGYAAAKHGVVGLTRNSAIEYGQFGIRINAIAPGAIWTPMVENSMKQLNADDPRKAAEEFIQINPTKRYGEADEIASVVAFLLSDDASYVNATVLPIDGGQSIKY